MSEQRSYESAVARLEEIIRRLDSGDAGLRETLELIREGRELVEYCAGELDAVSQGLEELRLEELIARLEQSGVRQASAETLAALADENRRYEESFGFVFLIAAAGKSAEQILGELRRRMEGDRETELAQAAEEHRKITRIRLERMLAS